MAWVAGLPARLTAGQTVSSSERNSTRLLADSVTMRRLLKQLALAILLSGCARMGDRPPWWKVENAPPVDPAILCATPSTASAEVAPELEPIVKRVHATVLEHSSAFANCYKATLVRDPVANGRVTVRALVLESGEVQTACVDSYDIADGDLLQCTTSTLKTIRFGALPKSVIFRYPFVFRVAKK